MTHCLRINCGELKPAILVQFCLFLADDSDNCSFFQFKTLIQ